MEQLEHVLLHLGKARRDPTVKQTAKAVLREAQRPRERQPLGSPRGRDATRSRLQALCDVLPPDAELESARTALHEALANLNDPDVDVDQVLDAARTDATIAQEWAQAVLGPDERPDATTAPPPLPDRLEGDALIERKRLAGAGRSQEAGTAFGSRWSAAEREELQPLFDEHGRREAAVQFAEAHPHRTVEGALYQIDRNITKRAQ